MMSNQLLLLKIVSRNGNVSSLRKRGLAPAQIALLIEDQINCGNLFVTEDSIILTAEGESALKAFERRMNLNGADSWIQPQEQMYCEPLDSNIIILPKRKKI